MSQPKPVLVLLLLVAASMCACTAGLEPLLTAITKGAVSTALYTAPLNAGRPLVLDLSAPAVTRSDCMSGQTNTLPQVFIFANSTDGANPTGPSSFVANATCAAPPSGAFSVAGLARSSASLPAQVAIVQKVANSFALCLPSSGNGLGAAIFGGGPFYLAPPAERPSITTLLSDPVPLRQPFAGNPGYFVRAITGIAIDGAAAEAGPLVVGLSTTIPYTQLRSEVYRPFIAAFDRAMGRTAKVSAVSPFELCYDSSKLSPTLSGYSVPQVDVMLEGGTNLTVVGGNSMAQVNSGTACLAFVQAKASSGPAVLIGGFQMENRLVVLDNGKKQLSFTGYLGSMGFSCSNFNFTQTG